MSSPVNKMFETPDLTPSEIVLLHCDRFAPVPPRTRASRIGFEVQQAFFLLIFEIPAMGLACGLSDQAGTIVKVIAGLVAAGWPVGWWFLRRSELQNQEVGVSPLNGTRKAVASELLRASISAALLANEQCGALSFEIEHDGIDALFRKNYFRWPPNSLEEQLLRDRKLAVSEWSTTGSRTTAISPNRAPSDCCCTTSRCGKKRAHSSSLKTASARSTGRLSNR